MAIYIKYRITNTEPLRISDDSSSQLGQTMSLCHIPGSSMRGLVVNSLSGQADFEEYVGMLLSENVRFLNAYPVYGSRPVIPSPKGFYENKTEEEGKKEIQNVVVSGEFTEGFKRAGLGRFCTIDDDCLEYYSVATGSDLKIKINVGENEKKNVFRNEYILPNQQFEGYIGLEDAALAPIVRGVLDTDIYLGNARSSGFGRCVVDACEISEKLPYREYSTEGDCSGECYMLLLSDTVMRNANGEYCGLDLNTLGELLGVEGLKIMFCSTSTVTVRGYNRNWGGRIPSVTMYEKGSVFHFRFQGTMKKEKMEQLSQSGIGIRRNEGFGRVLFLKDYPKISYKRAGNKDNVDAKVRHCGTKKDNDTVIRTVAKNYYRQLVKKATLRYVVTHPLEKNLAAGSQLGKLESIAVANEFDAKNGERCIKEYIKHALEKEESNNTHKERRSLEGMEKLVKEIFDSPIGELLGIESKDRESVMGIPKKDLLSGEDEILCRMQLLIEMIRFANKKED